MEMIKSHHNPLLLLLSAVLVAVPAYMFVLWIVACNQTPGYPYNQQLYQSWLPGFLHGRYASGLYGFACAALAIICSALAVPGANKTWKALTLVVLILACIMAAANLWSLM
jgi:hypothetical protein